MSAGGKQKCRLFLEGREVPFVSATLMCTVGEPITAVINMIPLQVIKFIRPKTQVHIFVQDPVNFGDMNFYLAFEGEVVGRSMQKAHDGRSFQVTAQDYSAYWEEAKAYFYNPNFILGKIETVTQGDTTPDQDAKAAGATITPVTTVLSAMVDILTSPKNSDLVAGVVKVFENLSKLNLFYKAAWERLRINDRIRVFTSGKIKTFLEDIKVNDFLNSYTGSQGGLTSLREMLLSVMGLVFHTFISVPFPSRVSVNKTISGVVTPISVGETIGSFLFVPDGYTLPPPKCNVIFPNQIQSFEMTDDFRAAPTRFAFRASFPEFIQTEFKVSTYPIQYYPNSFSDYMFGNSKRRETDEEAASLIGASTILKDKSGKSYRQVRFGAGKKAAIGGTAISPTLRESDFLTNEESIRGIFLDIETLMPSMTAMAVNNKNNSRMKFTQEVGKYLFFKKKFAARNAHATLMFNPFLVPGFNCLLIDDSESGQTVIAKIQSITHNMTHEGFSTSVSLGYARDFDEVDALSGGSGEPPLPRWFDKSKFGYNETDAGNSASLFSKETTYLSAKGFIDSQETRVRSKITNATVFDKMSSFYQLLIGVDSVTDVDGQAQNKNKKSALVTTRGAASYLTSKYRDISSTPNARDKFVFDYIRRNIPTMADTFFFLGAKPEGTSNTIPDEFAVFDAATSGPLKGRFDGKGYEDGDILAVRREIIDEYVLQLKGKRGFRG